MLFDFLIIFDNHCFRLRGQRHGFTAREFMCTDQSPTIVDEEASFIPRTLSCSDHQTRVYLFTFKLTICIFFSVCLDKNGRIRREKNERGKETWKTV